MISSRKIFALNIILIILLSSAIAWYTLPSAPVAKGQGFTSLDIAVSPSGSSFKLDVNQTQTFSTEALNGTAPFKYVWSINPTGNFTLSINGVTQEVSNLVVLNVEGQNLTLSYPVATEEFVSLTVSVKDANGFSGATWKPIVVADPYNSPGYKFDGSTASYSVYIQADTLGWYRAINGTDGSVIGIPSTNASYVGNIVYATHPASVMWKAGDYPLTNPIWENFNNTKTFGEGYGTHLYLVSGRPHTTNNDWMYWTIFGSDVTVENATFSNIRFDGNYLNNLDYTPIGHGSANIWFNAARHVTAENCWFENHRIVGFTIMSYGVQSFDNHVLKSTATNNQWNQISLGAGDQDTYGCSIENCYTSGLCGDISISLTGVSAQVRDSKIIGNIIDGMTGVLGSSVNPWYGIKLEASHDITVSQNLIKNIAFGIADDSSGKGNNTIIENTIYTKAGGIAGYAVGIEMSQANNLIEGNRIYAENAYGILLPGSTTINIHNRVIFNLVSSTNASNWITGIRDNGDYNFFMGNDLRDTGNKFDPLAAHSNATYNFGVDLFP